MKKTIIINLFAVLAIFANLSFTVTQSQYDYWNGKLLSQPLNHQFANTPANASTNEFEWPEVVSIQYKSQLNTQEKQLNANFRALSLSLLDKLDNYHKEIETSTDEDFSSKITPLIKLRDKIAKNPGYVNYILVDHINRILVANTAERLVKSIPLPSNIDNVVSNIYNCPMNINIFKNIFEKENAQTYNLNTSNTLYKTKFERLWNKISTDSNYIFPKNLKYSISYDMIDSSHIEMLLYRIYITSQYIDSLSCLLEYRKLVSDYSLNDSYQKIRSILKENACPVIIDLPGTHSKALMAGRLMKSVKNNKLNYLIDFRLKKLKLKQ